jgi:VIT1/CCC1 family predicted Fe2+/Mn2+ transporter
MAEHLISEPTTALDTLAREELGIDPEELGGSAWEAALTSFGLFAVGAIFPMVPYLIFQEVTAIIASAVFSAAGLFLIGALITLMTGKHPVLSGLRQVLFGLASAGVTFGIGKIIGVSLQ